MTKWAAPTTEWGVLIGKTIGTVEVEEIARKVSAEAGRGRLFRRWVTRTAWEEITDSSGDAA